MVVETRMSSTGSLETLLKDKTLSADSKKILTAISKMFGEMKEEFKRTVEAKDARIIALENRVTALEQRCDNLQVLSDENECYERRDCLIFDGSVIPSGSNTEKSVDVVCTLVRDQLNLNLSANDISVSHRLGRMRQDDAVDRRKIIAKFCRRDTKRDILQACRRTKPANFYVSESVSPLRSTILYALRKMKKVPNSRVKRVTTQDGSVTAFVSASPNAPATAALTKVTLNTRTKLQEFCTSMFNKPLSDFVQNWP